MADNPNLLAILHEIAAKENLINYEIIVKPISTGGANYTSHLFSIVISTADQKLNLFAKVAAFGEKFLTDMTINVFETEKFIYSDLQAAYRQLEEKHGLKEKDRLRMSKCYGAHTKAMEELIVFEDLTSQGFTTHDRFKSMDWEYGSACCTEMAKLHALSMAYEHENPAKFKKAINILFFDMLKMNQEGMKGMWDGCRQKALGAVREENRRTFKKFLEGMDVEEFFSHFNSKGKAVLMHGDYRMSNIMHREREDGSIEVVPVDYQTIRGGSPLVDLYYFIFTGTDAKFRAQYFDKLTAHYDSELRAALTRLGVNPDHVYSRGDYKFELKEKLPFGLGLAVFCLPIITVEAENAPIVDKDFDMNSFNVMKTGELYPVRLNEVVDDFVRWGVL